MNHHYQVLSYSIGKGAFGEVYLGVDRKDSKLVAIKTEIKSKKSVLVHENNIIRYTEPKTSSDATTNNYVVPLGVVKSRFFWEDQHKYYLVTDLLGPSMDSLHKICGRSFTLKTTLMLAEQMLGLVKYYHQHNVVHRDIKPANFLINYDLPHTYLCLIDFGLAHKYKIKDVHIPFASGVNRVGSLRYMSKNVHNSIEATCRDDMYSLGYCIIFLFTGILPWQGENVTRLSKKERHSYVGELKTETSNQTLTMNCACNDCRKQNKPCRFQQCILDYFNYLDSLDYADEVNYNYLIKDLLVCFKEHGFSYDYKWDWNKYYIISDVGI